MLHSIEKKERGRRLFGKMLIVVYVDNEGGQALIFAQSNSY